MIDGYLSYYKNPYRSRLQNHKANHQQLKQLKQPPANPTINTMICALLFCIVLHILAVQVMVWIVSCFYKMPEEDYVNPYRLPPVREEHENYKRYERQQYLDSLKNYKRRG